MLCLFAIPCVYFAYKCSNRASVHRKNMDDLGPWMTMFHNSPSSEREAIRIYSLERKRLRTQMAYIILCGVTYAIIMTIWFRLLS